MAMRGRDMDEVESQRRRLGGGYGYGGPELGRLIQKQLLVAPRILVEPARAAGKSRDDPHLMSTASHL